MTTKNGWTFLETKPYSKNLLSSTIIDFFSNILFQLQPQLVVSSYFNCNDCIYFLFPISNVYNDYGTISYFLLYPNSNIFNEYTTTRQIKVCLYLWFSLVKLIVPNILSCIYICFVWQSINILTIWAVVIVLGCNYQRH